MGIKHRTKRQGRAAHAERMEPRAYLAAHIAGSATSYATIQAAVNAASAGAVINVDAGTYAGNIVINKTLTLVGAEASKAGAASRGAESIIYDTPTDLTINANDVTIEGFTLKGYQTNIGAGLGAGIIMGPSIHGTRIINNDFEYDITGLYVSNNSNTDACVIQGNFFYDDYETGNYWNTGWNGSRDIYSDGSVSGGLLTNVNIVNNTFSKDADWDGNGPIDLHAQSPGQQFNVNIISNLFESNGNAAHALVAINVSNLTFIGNTVYGQSDTYDGALNFEGNDVNVNIQYNSLYQNADDALAADQWGTPGENSGFVVENNNIYSNAVNGLWVNGPDYSGTVLASSNWWGGGAASVVGGATFVTSPVASAKIVITKVPAPAAPTGLSALPNSASSINLAWTAPDSTATSQLVQRSTNNSTYTTVATLSPLVNAYTDTGLTTSKTYYYRIVASNSTGNSSPSGVASAVPPVYRAPVAPTGLAVTAVTGSTVSLAWNVPSYTVGLVGYTIYRNGVAVGTSATTSFTDTGLFPTTLYAYTVASNDNTGAVSSASGSVSTTTHVANFLDPSFESTRVGAYETDPTTANWTFTGNAGIQSNGSQWGGPWAPDGTQTAFVEGQDGADGNFSQAIPVNAGIYSISFAASQSANFGVEPIAVSVDGVLLATITPAAQAFATYSTPSITLTTGKHIFTFAATSSAGANVSFIDTVSLNLVSGTTAPAAPTRFAALGLSNTQVMLTWSTTGTPPSSFTLERSTDNVNFTPVATGLPGSSTSYIDSSGLAPSTNYYYQLIAVNQVGSTPAENVASAATVSAAVVTTPLSSLKWTSATAGWGTPQLNASVAGNKLTLKGVTYASGIGTHAASTIVYNLAGGYAVFQAAIGIDDEEIGKGSGSVDFQVIGDGVVLFDSGVLTSVSPTMNIAVPVTGVKTLSLVATNGIPNNIDYDHADWAGAVLWSVPQALPAPTGLTAVTSSQSQINLSWTTPTGPGAAAVTGYLVQHSSDGVNFTPVATIGSAATTHYNDAGLAAGATWTYRLLATSLGGNSAPSVVASATTLAATAVITNLSSLKWTSATAGWGTTQLNASIAGNPITLRGTKYATGIGTHAASTIVYNLNGAYSSFLSDVGIDDEEIGKGAGAVDFQVIGDGKVLFDSGVLTDASAVVSLDVNVKGVKTLTLVASNGIAGNIDYDHADWAGARLIV